MIVDKNKQADVISENFGQETIEMGLDNDSAQFLMQMLSKNLYSDPIGSTIRETCSNALDSHRRANSTDPVVVSLYAKPDGSIEFSVEDFGTGLDNEDVQTIISKYGKSTKREIANEFGMFGIGFKSPLSYTSSFVFITRKDGVERSYIMYEGENINSIDLLYESPTTHKNGTKVIVPVKNSWVDFYDKVQEQLCYFRDVYFTGLLEGINDIKLYESDDYIISTKSLDQDLHVCLDNVYYPLDFNKLGMSRIFTNIALKFNLSEGLVPTPNRESLRYNKESIQLIKDKIYKVAEDLVIKYNEEDHDYDDIKDLLEFYRTDRRYLIIDELRIDITDLIRLSNTPPKNVTLKGVKLIDIKAINDSDSNIWICEYKMVNRMGRGKLTAPSSYLRSSTLSDAFLLTDDKISATLKSYLRDNHRYNYSTKYIIKKDRNLKLRKRNYLSEFDYESILSLNNYPKSEWRTRIQDFQLVRDNFLKNVPIINNASVPAEYVKELKETRAAYNRSKGPSKVRDEDGNILKGIPVKLAVTPARFLVGKFCKFEAIRYIPYKDFLSRVIIYDTHDNSDRLNNLYPLVVRMNVILITLSDRQFKSFSRLKIRGTVSYDEFMKGHHKIFRRMATSAMIGALINDFDDTFDMIHHIEKVSLSLHDDLNFLQTYYNNYYNSNVDSTYKNIIEIATNNNYFDGVAYSIYSKTLKLLEHYRFINEMYKCYPSRYGGHPEYNECIINLFKYHKLRVNNLHYKLKTTTL